MLKFRNTTFAKGEGFLQKQTFADTGRRLGGGGGGGGECGRPLAHCVKSRAFYVFASLYFYDWV